jgi:hypothetical protein
LTAVIPARFADQLDDARCQVDFLMNSSLLAVLTCIVALVRLCQSLSATFWHDANGYHLYLNGSLLFLAVAVAALLVALIAYDWSISAVVAWGELVRTAFDLYLPALAAALGFQLPRTRINRMRFWEDFSSTASYGVDPGGSVDFTPDIWAPTKPGAK